MAWSHVQAWEAAAAELGVTISGPLAVQVTPTILLPVDMWVQDFGRPKGALVASHSDTFWPLRKEIVEAGYHWSSFGPYGDQEVARREDLIEVLTDWGWCGQSDPPPWYVVSRAELEATWPRP
jgi:hypothetical protein